MTVTSLSDLVQRINEDLGEFCNEFLLKRKELLNHRRMGKRNQLFSHNPSNGRDWAINEGGGIEVQYHLTLKPDEEVIRYGLGFNAQYVPFNNTQSAVDYIKPFTHAFLSLGIDQQIPDYDFIYEDKGFMSNPYHNGYALFGKEIEVTRNGDAFDIVDTVYQRILEDLRMQFHHYVEIFNERNKMIAAEGKYRNIKELLNVKPQIILQGPPGTGKTFMAKELAYELIFDAFLDDKNRKNYLEELENSDQFELIQFHPSYSYEDFVRGIQPEVVDGSIAYRTENKVLVEMATRALNNYVDSKKDTEALTQDRIIEQQFDQFLEHIQLQLEAQDNKVIIGDTTTYIIGVEEEAIRYKGDNWNTKYGNRMTFDDLLKLIHANVQERQEAKYIPGISGLASQHISYFFKVVQMFYEFAKDNPVEGEESWIEQQIIQFAEHIQDAIRKGPEDFYVLKSNDSVTIRFASKPQQYFKFRNKTWDESASGFELTFSQLKSLYQAEAFTLEAIKSAGPSLNGRFPKESYAIILEFLNFLEDRSSNPISGTEKEKSYVLLIDEINRANLPSVLGELIYGLEYRGEKVDSIYSKDGNKQLILPPNLLILGTMNTTDRSIGHIDYAIRRRFAFVDVLPNLEVIRTNACEEAEVLFQSVQGLFYREDGMKKSEHLSPEFRPEEVLIGHSYFLEEDVNRLNTRLHYEIKPILKEYVKDGILLESALDVIEKLHV